jgi:hypothetical protein
MSIFLLYGQQQMENSIGQLLNVLEKRYSVGKGFSSLEAAELSPMKHVSILDSRLQEAISEFQRVRRLESNSVLHQCPICVTF